MTLTYGSILRRIGLELQRDGACARPIAVTPPPVACAWCDQEAGIKPHPGMNQSHGICERHLASIKAHMDELRRMAA